MTDGTLEELAQAREEIARLTALLPPVPTRGHWVRQGTQVPRNLYLHTADDPKGFPIGQMVSDEIAAFLCEAANAHLAQRYGGEVSAPSS